MSDATKVINVEGPGMSEATVFIVDDEADIRDDLSWLVQTVGLTAQTYASAQNFLEGYIPGAQGCLLLDLRMPGMGGLELQKELEDRKIDLPIIFLSGHGDVSVAVHAMKAGAVDFIEKPFSHQILLEKVQSALLVSAENHASSRTKSEGPSCLKVLTEREREVLDKLVSGKINKVIARELDISIKTVEFHRSNVMKKMEAYSLADLIEKASGGS